MDQLLQLPHVGGSHDKPTGIFVKGIAKGSSERCIANLFQMFGQVVNCQVARHRSGRSAGFAIVVFATHEQALTALQTDNVVLNGRKLSVRWYQPEREGVANQQAALLLSLASAAQLQGLGATTDLHGLHSAAQLQSLTTALNQQLVLDQLLSSSYQQPQSAGPALMMDLPDQPELRAWAAQQVAHEVPAAPDDIPEGIRRWSALVDHWLQDYLNSQEAATPSQLLRTSSSDPEAEGSAASCHSSDGHAPPADAAAASMSDLALSSKDHHSAAYCGDVTAGNPAAVSNIPATASSILHTLAGHASNDAHALANIKMLSTSAGGAPFATSPNGANAFPSSPNNSTSFASLGTWSNLSKLSMAPSSPTTPKPFDRNSSWGSHDDGAMRSHQALDQIFRDAAAASSPTRMSPVMAGIPVMQPSMQSAIMQGHRPRALHFSPPMSPVRTRAGHSPMQRAHVGSFHTAAGRQFQQMNAMQKAQEQYVSALSQYSSAQSHVMAAAALLQGAGMLPQPLHSPGAGAAAPAMQQRGAGHTYISQWQLSTI